MNMRQLSASAGKQVVASPEGGRSLDLPYPGGIPPESESEKGRLRATILKCLGLALKHKWLILAFTVAALFVGAVTTLMMTKVFVASTTVKIDRIVPKVMKSQDSSSDGGNDPQFFRTQYELIKSRALAERVAASLNLVQSDVLSPAGSTLAERVQGLLPAGWAPGTWASRALASGQQRISTPLAA